MGLSGIEPLTSRLSGERSNQLSYRPIMFVNILEGNKMSRAKPIAPKLLPHNINRRDYKGKIRKIEKWENQEMGFRLS
jgi:hypothetical protein